jgi:hypothetical protein
MLEAYLRDIADTDRALSRQLVELLELIRQYGPEPVADAIAKASAARAFGADYIANILRHTSAFTPVFSSRLAPVFARYVDLKRALGRRSMTSP